MADKIVSMQRDFRSVVSAAALAFAAASAMLALAGTGGCGQKGTLLSKKAAPPAVTAPASAVTPGPPVALP